MDGSLLKWKLGGIFLLFSKWRVWASKMTLSTKFNNSCDDAVIEWLEVVGCEEKQEESFIFCLRYKRISWLFILNLASRYVWKSLILYKSCFKIIIVILLLT